MNKVTTVGIDLAKRVFALHGVDGGGRVTLRISYVPTCAEYISRNCDLNPVFRRLCQRAHDDDQSHPRTARGVRDRGGIKADRAYAGAAIWVPVRTNASRSQTLDL